MKAMEQVPQVAGWRPDPGVHGGDGRRLAAAVGLPPEAVLDLSASLNPAAPDVSPTVAAHLDAIGRYPDAERATAALAEVLAEPADQVLLTNGGAEAIGLVGAALGGSVEEPDFSLYPRSGGPRWRSNPNNPLGTLAPANERAGVWDEAFWPLATGTWTRGDHRRGAVVVGSLTKLFACPGLRAGYVLCEDRDLIARLRAAQPSWSVNGLVCDALPELLATADLDAWRSETAALRSELIALLARHGIDAEDTAAPWVLVHGAPSLRDRLLRQAVAIRDCTSFGLAGTVRIAVPRARDLPTLEAALRLATGG